MRVPLTSDNCFNSTWYAYLRDLNYMGSVDAYYMQLIFQLDSTTLCICFCVAYKAAKQIYLNQFN